MIQDIPNHQGARKHPIYSSDVWGTSNAHPFMLTNTQHHQAAPFKERYLYPQSYFSFIMEPKPDAPYDEENAILECFRDLRRKQFAVQWHPEYVNTTHEGREFFLNSVEAIIK